MIHNIGASFQPLPSPIGGVEPLPSSLGLPCPGLGLGPGLAEAAGDAVVGWPSH